MLIKRATATGGEMANNGVRRVAPAPRAEGPRILSLHDGADDGDALRLLTSLCAAEPQTDPKFFYDAQGCALFDAICRLDEYYPTRTEAWIFSRYRAEIARALPRGGQWIDLGAGDGAKARDWLAVVGARRYIGIDIAEIWLRLAVARIDEAYPHTEGMGVVADLTQPLALHALLAEMPDSAPVFFYPGSSIGNFAPERALVLLKAIRSHCDPDTRFEGRLDGQLGGRLLIGIDLVKNARVLEAAYDDLLGVTAAFNRNLLRVANRLLGANFDLRGFEHSAVFNAIESRIEMHLRARHEQTVRFHRPQPAERTYASGERILTECSYKYTPATFGDLLAQAGFRTHRMWTDPAAGFGVFLAVP